MADLQDLPQAPPQSVLDAFDIQNPLQPLSGGRGLCFLAGDVVLRPVDYDIETQWLSELLLKISQLPHASQEYRIAKPFLSKISSAPGAESQFIVDGWSASAFAAGKDGPRGKFRELFIATRAFHRDVKGLVSEPPAFVFSKPDRWAEADRVTWEEKGLNDVPDVNHDVLKKINPYLEKLEEIKKPIPKDALKYQMVHGDLSGNVLFDDTNRGLAPAIIDITPYWRPVEFSEAVVVADGITGYRQGIELIELYGTDELRLQVLVRALYWRILTFAIQSDLPWIEKYMPNMDFEKAVRLVQEVVRREDKS
jgi:uncharacterized protein (TIGR02569 family)